MQKTNFDPIARHLGITDERQQEIERWVEHCFNVHLFHPLLDRVLLEFSTGEVQEGLLVEKTTLYHALFDEKEYTHSEAMYVMYVFGHQAQLVNTVMQQVERGGLRLSEVENLILQRGTKEHAKKLQDSLSLSKRTGLKPEG